MNIYKYKQDMSSIRLYRSKFKCEEDFEDLLKFLDLPFDCHIIDIDVQSTKVIINGKTYYNRSYGGR